MLDYKKICANCLKQANIVVGLWEGLYERSLNFGDDITSPYDTMPLDDLDGGCKQINEICHDVENFEGRSLVDMLECYDMYANTNQLIRAFCDIIGEPYDKKYIAYDKQTFWSLEPISCKYAFTLLEMWWIVSEYDKLVEKYVCRENVEKFVKKWYKYHQNGGTVNLWQWMWGARDL